MVLSDCFEDSLGDRDGNLVTEPVRSDSEGEDQRSEQGKVSE
jgi:hypothetical protein